MSKSKYAHIFESIQNTKDQPLHLDSKVVLIDCMNMFLRSFAMIHHMNPNGHHIGGLTGFLKSLGFLIRHIKPTRVILVFDGLGNTNNKKNLFPAYKANRKLQRITNWDGFESREDESESITNQMLRLVEYLKCLPVSLMSIDKIEADDVIGYLSKELQNEVIIVSADRDFLQLVNERVSVYSPIKKKFYTPTAIKDEYGIIAENFLTQKILLGDQSDNIPGVNKIGPKTLLKLYPKLATEPVTIEEILEDAKDKKGRYEDIHNFRNQLMINKQLMDINNPNIFVFDKEDILNIVAAPVPPFSRNEFIKMYKEDCLGDSIPNVEFWLQDVFSYLTSYKIK